MKTKIYDAVVIGTGPVGLAAGMYSARLGMKTLIIGEQTGGVLTKTHLIENYPGFSSITSMELIKNFQHHALLYHAEILNLRVNKVEKKGENFELHAGKQKFLSKTVIFATGSRWRKLGVPGEKEFENRGVSYCAICDGPFFRGKTVGVVGGGYGALKEALLLTEYAERVYIIYRGKEVRQEEFVMRQIKEKIRQGKIQIITGTNIKEIKGTDVLTHVVLDKPYKKKKELKLDGLFIYIGSDPNTELAKSLKVKTNQKSEIITNKNSETNIAGIFAAGDATNSSVKQVITGVGDGVKAAYSAWKYTVEKK